MCLEHYKLEHEFRFQHPDTFVALGTTSLSDLRDVYAIGVHIIHPDYSPFTAFNDIALIQVTAFTFVHSQTLLQFAKRI